MFWNFATLIVGIVLLAIPSVAVKSGATFTVRVYNDAGVDRLLLEQAERVAGEIFHGADLTAVWKNCGRFVGSETCAGTGDEVAFAVRIVRHSASLSGDAFGVAFVGDDGRSEERRVGKECRSRWSPYH